MVVAMGDTENLLIKELDEDIPQEDEKSGDKKDEKVKSLNIIKVGFKLLRVPHFKNPHYRC